MLKGTNGETRAIPTYRNGCKSSEKILWMTEFLNTETHTPVLLMNHLWSLRLREVRIWVNTIVYPHFPKDRNCEIFQRTKITRAPCRRRIGRVVPRAENFGADHKVVSEGCESRNNHRYAVVVQDLATQWIQSYPCKTKTSGNTKELAKSSWSRIGNQKSFTLTIPWNSAKLVKISPGIIARLHHTDPKQMRLLREQYAEWKKVHLQYCCNQIWMKIGGQNPWNAIPICETLKISCLMGKLYTKGVLENHVKDQSFRLVHWLSITLFLRKTSQESINLERKSYLDCSLDTLCTREEIWKGDMMVANVEELQTMDASEIYSERVNAKEVIFSKRKWKIHLSSRRWTNQIFWRRSGTENTHLDTGSPNSRRKSKGFSWRIRRVSSSTTSRLTSRCRWSDKWLLVHVRKLHIPPSRWTQSQTLLAERRIIP